MSAKSRKVPRPTLPLVLNVLSENGIIFILIGLFLRSKIMLISQKRVFYKRGTRINMGNILLHKCLLYGAAHLYNYTVEKFNGR